VGNITLVEGLPSYADRCIFCLRCFNYCPELAILAYKKAFDPKSFGKAPYQGPVPEFMPEQLAAKGGLMHSRRENLGKYLTGRWQPAEVEIVALRSTRAITLIHHRLDTPCRRRYRYAAMVIGIAGFGRPEWRLPPSILTLQ
jgi:ferredoxin